MIIRRYIFYCPECRKEYAQSLSSFQLGSALRRCLHCTAVNRKASREWLELKKIEKFEFWFPTAALGYMGAVIVTWIIVIPQMSDGDIRQIENILVEAVVALQRDDVKTYATRDREFHEAIAEQSGNAALIEALRQFGLQIRLCGTISNVNGEFAERTAHGYDDIIQAFKARDAPRAAFLVRAHISRAQEAILARFPNETASR